jgi:taurine dioxygenase
MGDGIVRTLEIEPLTSTLAARVGGVQLTELDDAGVEAVRDALHRHGVLVFPEQRMTRDEQVAFAGRLGEVHDHPVREFLSGGGDPVSIVENDASKPPQDDQHFHVDYSFNTVIPDLAVLRAEVIPERGGDTIWSSAAAAYDALSPRIKELLAGLEAVHDAGDKFWFEMRRTIGEQATNRARDRFAGNRHPIVGPHPYSGRMLLFVNPGYTVRIEGVSTRESAGLLRMLFDHVNDPAFHFRHRWRAGDVVMWDEHQTTHMGPSDFYPAERRLARVTAGQHAPCRAAA